MNMFYGRKSKAEYICMYVYINPMHVWFTFLFFQLSLHFVCLPKCFIQDMNWALKSHSTPMDSLSWKKTSQIMIKHSMHLFLFLTRMTNLSSVRSSQVSRISKLLAINLSILFLFYLILVNSKLRKYQWRYFKLTHEKSGKGV